MFSWLKKYLIPNKGGDHRSRILRKKDVSNFILLILLVGMISFLLPVLNRVNKGGNMAAVVKAVLASLTNKERATRELPDLITNPLLDKAAEMKARDMAEKGYFSHVSPDGKTPWYWIKKAGYEYKYAGENLAVNFKDSEDVTNAWMASPTHKANIIKPNYTEVGTGTAEGRYEGREATFVVQMYGRPIHP